MAYTWEEVMMGIDVRNEQARKAEDKRKAEEMTADEATAAGYWSLGLSVLGMALGLGPLGYYAGKQIGNIVADVTHPWEDMEMEVGKFYTGEAKEFNRLLDKSAEDQTAGQILSGVVDLGKAYVMSGGLTAEPGEWNPFTWGSGEGEWSLYGKKGTPGEPFTKPTWASSGKGGMIDPATGEAIGSAPMPAGTAGTPGVPSLFSGGMSERVMKTFGADKAIQGVGDLARLWGNYLVEEDNPRNI
tara:strand:- start:198 stop:926 length:729 start_codon:yes stop_codon:yes gene_type:complete